MKKLFRLLVYALNPYVLRLELLEDDIIENTRIKTYKQFIGLCESLNIKFCDNSDFVGKQINSAGFYQYCLSFRDTELFMDDPRIYIDPDNKDPLVLLHELGHYFTLLRRYSDVKFCGTETITEVRQIAFDTINAFKDKKEKAADDYIPVLARKYIHPMDAFVLRPYFRARKIKLSNAYGHFWFFKYFVMNITWIWNYMGDYKFK